MANVGSGCGDKHCGDHEPSSAGGAPVVTNFWKLAEQVPGDPWTVVFGVEFADSDQDLASGQAEFYLNDSTSPTAQALADAFRQSGLAEATTSGSLWMALRFADNVSDGTSVRLGLQLIDGGGRRSNCFTLSLEFEVQPVASLTPRRLLRATPVRCSAVRSSHGRPRLG